MNLGVQVSFHHHKLYLTNEQKLWYCDSLSINNIKCEGNHNKTFKNWNCKKYSCKNCNFVICESCASKYGEKSIEQHKNGLEISKNDQRKNLVNISIHSHPLFLKSDDKKWYCDSLTLNKKCERNQIKKCAAFPYKGYQCDVAGCEYTFCDLCVYYNLINEDPETILNIKVHPHHLVCFSPLPIKWSCCIKNLGKTCLTNTTSMDDYHVEKAFFCSECKFALCELDAKDYDIEGYKNSLGTSNFLKQSQIEEKIAKIILRINIHPHPVYLSYDKKPWYCDSLTKSIKCERNQTLKSSSSQYSYKKYICEKGCGDVFCDLCVLKYMNEEGPEIFIKTKLHPHPLKYYSKLPIEWCCEIIKFEKNCLKNLTRADYNENGVYSCIKCNFSLCDLDAKQFEEIIDLSEETNLNNKILSRGSNLVDVSENNKNEDLEDVKNQKIQSTAISSSKKKELFDDKLIQEKYHILRNLGNGGFGIVFLFEAEGKQFALKVIETFDIDEMNKGLSEINSLSRLKGHENILSYEKYYLNPPIQIGNKFLYQICIEMKYAQKTLTQFIAEAQDKGIDKKLALDIFQQIANGLSYAHSQKCVHLDIKPDNILFVDSICKIADWGGSLILNSDQTTKIQSQEISVTKGYVAPEIIDQNYYDRKKFNYYHCDIYSFGIMMLRCCGISKNEILDIHKSKKKLHDEDIDAYIDEVVSTNYPKQLCELIRSMCKFEVSLRPTISVVLNTLKEIQ